MTSRYDYNCKRQFFFAGSSIQSMPRVSKTARDSFPSTTPESNQLLGTRVWEGELINYYEPRTLYGRVYFSDSAFHSLLSSHGSRELTAT